MEVVIWLVASNAICMHPSALASPLMWLFLILRPSPSRVWPGSMNVVLQNMARTGHGMNSVV